VSRFPSGLATGEQNVQDTRLEDLAPYVAKQVFDALRALYPLLPHTSCAPFQRFRSVIEAESLQRHILGDPKFRTVQIPGLPLKPSPPAPKSQASILKIRRTVTAGPQLSSVGRRLTRHGDSYTTDEESSVTDGLASLGLPEDLRTGVIQHRQVVPRATRCWQYSYLEARNSTSCSVHAGPRISRHCMAVIRSQGAPGVTTPPGDMASLTEPYRADPQTSSYRFLALVARGVGQVVLNRNMYGTLRSKSFTSENEKRNGSGPDTTGWRW
jgi:hypothetical protein